MTSKPRLPTRLMAWSVLALMAASPAFAEQAWQPFKDKDEKAAAARDRAKRAPQAEQRPNEAPPIVAQQPAAPAFTPPPKGTVEKVELEPLPGQVPAEATAPPIQGQAAPAGPTNQAQQRPLPASPAMPGLVPTESGPAVVNDPTQRSALGAAPPRAIGAKLPADLWRNVDLKQLEALIQPLDVPPRSAALNALWQSLFLADATPPAGGSGPNHYAALQFEVLYRSGLIDVMKARLAKADPDDPLLAIFKVRRDLAAAETDAACAGVKVLSARRQQLPKVIKGEAHILSGYCAAVAGNPAAAGLAAELAREEEIEAPVALQALDAIAAQQAGGAKPKLPVPKRLTVLEYRLLSLATQLDPVQVLNSAEPALLYALSQTADTPAKLAIAAAEAAAALHALTAEQLVDVYKRVDTSAAGNDPLLRRAALFKQMSAETTPQKKLTLARQLIDDARRSGLALTLAKAAAVELAAVQPSPDLGPAAATAAELAIVAGEYDRARRFAASSPQAAHWAPLAELADPAMRGVSTSALTVLDDAVRRNRFAADHLHRIVVVLDAFDINVPIPLWEAASRTPQPTAGYLPETGTLPQLQEASSKKEIGRTALLAMRAIGTQGPDAANLITLGDTLRALRRAGLDADARRLATEALYAGWPRG